MTLNTLVFQEKGNLVTDMDGETVIMSIQNSKYYNLGGTGSIVWSLLKKPIQVNEVIEKLCIEFNVDQSTCSEQVILFLESLYKEGLVKIEEVAAR